MRRKRDVERLHVLGRYLQQQMDKSDLKPADVARRADISASYISKLLDPSQAGAPVGMLGLDVIARLVAVVGGSEREMLLHAAKAAGAQIEVDQIDAPPLTDDQLIQELARRLRECTPVIEPMEIPRDSIVFTQLTELRAEIDTAEQAARSATPVQEWRVRGWEHLGAYLDALIVRGDAPPTDS